MSRDRLRESAPTLVAMVFPLALMGLMLSQASRTAALSERGASATTAVGATAAPAAPAATDTAPATPATPSASPAANFRVAAAGCPVCGGVHDR